MRKVKKDELQEHLNQRPLADGLGLYDEDSGELWVSAGIGGEWGRMDLVWFGPYTQSQIELLGPHG